MIVIHIHTKDSGFEESKHPRASNGEFGAGGGGVQVTSKKRVKVDMEGTHTEIKLSDGKTHRIQKLTSGESMGLPGWHDLDSKDQHNSYLADSEAEAINLLTARANKGK